MSSVTLLLAASLLMLGPAIAGMWYIQFSRGADIRVAIGSVALLVLGVIAAAAAAAMQRL